MRRRRRPLDAFVGRDRELAALVGSLDRALAGEVAVALVVGEAGIGKSRLVDALAVEARGRDVRVVWGEATERHQAPLSLWTGVERSLGLGRDRVDRSLPSSERRWETVELMGVELADVAPVVVVLEDLHWADEGSLWVLERLPRLLLGHQVLLVGTSRGDEPGAMALAGVRQQAMLVELSGLDVEAVERLIDALGPEGSDGPDESHGPDRSHRPDGSEASPGRRGGERVDAAELVARTAGNPLFLRELLALGGQEGRLPSVVSSVLQRSLARLDSDVRDALAVLALGGPATPLVVLTAALGTTVDDVMARFEAAAAADVVVLGTTGHAEFRHILLSETATATLVPSGRRALHAALAEAWRVLDDSPTGLARAAEHRLAALPTGDPGAACTEALDAVQSLRAIGDDGGAAALAAAADRTLEACGVGDLATRARLVVHLGHALDALGEELRAQEVFARAADLAIHVDQPELRAVAEVGACRKANPLVAYPERLRRLAAVEAALAPGDHPLRVGLLGRMSVLRCALPDALDAAHADGDAGVAMARRLRDPDLLVTALADRHFVPFGVAGLEARAEAADEIVALGERSGRPHIALQGYEWRYGDRLDQGDRNGANAALEALEVYALVMPSPRWRWSAMVRRANLHLVDGDRAGALARADEVAELGMEAAEEPEALGMVFSIRATTTSLWGRPDPGLGSLYQRLKASTGPFAALPFIGLMHARAACVLGEPERAAPIVQRYAADPEPLLAGLEGIHLVALLGSMAAELGAVEHAARLRRVLAPFRDRLGTGSGIQVLLPVATTLGRLAQLEGDIDAAVAYHQHAVALVSTMPSPTLLAHCATHLAQALAARRDDAEAATALDQAHRVAQPLGILVPEAGLDPSRAEAGGHRRPGASLRRTDGGWRVASPHGVGTVADSLGIAQLALLLAARPGAEIPATDLAGMDAAAVPTARDLGAGLDARAKREYRRRLRDLQDDIDEAESNNDPDRAALARIELDAIVRELRRAVGLDGRDRPSGSGAERARVNVTRSLRRAVAAIAAQVPDLGAHLERSLRTGRFCSYSPEPSAALTWEIDT
ncbi:MAG: AAA family ATPase [Acidimicrobiales bacterium]